MKAIIKAILISIITLAIVGWPFIYYKVSLYINGEASQQLLIAQFFYWMMFGIIIAMVIEMMEEDIE